MRRVTTPLPSSGLQTGAQMPASGLRPSDDENTALAAPVPVGAQLADLEKELTRIEFSMLGTMAKLHGAGPPTKGEALDKMDGIFSAFERVAATVRRLGNTAEAINSAV